MPQAPDESSPLFFLVAGESSGDLLGARLMAALTKLTRGQARFAGIGGPRMQAQGMDLLFPQSELALFGLAELLPKIPHILKRLKQTAKAVRDLRPAALITIDAPDFNFRLGEKLKGAGIPLIHYAAPTVWAWRPGRARKIARFLDCLLTLFPFEPPYFTREGLRADFVGHPLVESIQPAMTESTFRATHGLAPDVPILTILPGSRMSEVTRLLPDFRATVAKIKAAIPDLVCALPLAPGVADYVRGQIAGWPAPVLFLENDGDKYACFKASRAALAASGTVALELALHGLPAVIAYRIHPATVLLYRRLIYARYVNLVNIMHDRMVVPELIQDYCRPDLLADCLLPLMRDTPERRRQVEALASVGAWLGAQDAPPSERAARAVLDVVAKAG